MKRSARIVVATCLSMLCFTSCATARFDEAYVRAHAGRVEVLVDETQELVHAALTITKVGQRDLMLLDHDRAYFDEAAEYFLPFANHPLIKALDTNLQAAFGEPNWERSYKYYHWLNYYAPNYGFDEGGSLRDLGILREGINARDPIRENMPAFADFARKSEFRKFFRERRDYYESLVAGFRGYAHPETQIAWLAAEIGGGADCYRIHLSPLMKGLNFAQYAESGEFSQVSVFVSFREADPTLDRDLNSMKASELVFTEFDNYFVKDYLGKNSDGIAKAFARLDPWLDRAKTGEFYASARMCFNEYLTWALFSLYCLDTYPAESVQRYLPLLERQMARDRGFLRFPAFNEELIRVHASKRDEGFDAIVEEMVAWCLAQG